MLTDDDGVQAPAFAAAGAFYKGNLHTHSTLSDGALAPEEVCARYRDAGYDFLALTDHFVGRFGYPIADTTAFRTNAFTTALGAEIHTGRMRTGEIWHLLAVGLPPDFAPPNAPGFEPEPGAESAASLAQRAAEAGAFVAIAHPQWSSLNLEDALEIEAAHSVEIYNHGCAVDSDRGDGAATLDQLLSAGRRLTACATDDAHFHAPDAFGGWVMVKSESLAPEALVASLRGGLFYASQGPRLRDMRVGAETAAVMADAADDGSPIDRVVAVGAGSASAVLFAENFEGGPEGIVARVPLGPVARSPWLRVTAIDRAGRRAWSNPVWRAEA